jgi:hypothetical protein
LKNGWRTFPSADFARYSISASSDGSPHSWISGITLQPDMRRACQNRRE